MTAGGLIRFVLATAGLMLATAVQAAETGVLIRADVLRDKPFIDAAEVDKLAANAPVTIAARQGGWVQVDAGGKTGWVRTLNVRLGSGGTGGGSSLLAASSLYRTGSSGTQVTTGVKGLGEGDITAASPNSAQLAMLNNLRVTPAAASEQAAQNGLKTNTVDYLQAGKKKK
jgi:flagellar basal body rod protein FlgF